LDLPYNLTNKAAAEPPAASQKLPLARRAYEGSEEDSPPP
jgi:hypothetical protein